MISLPKVLDRPIARDDRKFDVSLLWTIILMTTLSLVMIYSASIVYAASDGGSQFSFMSKQAMFVLFTAAMCLPLFLLKISFRRRIIPFHFVVSGLLLLLVLPVGREINDVTHWIHIRSSNLQPAELFKLTTVLYSSSLFTRREEMLRDLDSLGWLSLFTDIGDLMCSPFKSEARVKVKERFRKFKALILSIISVAIGLVLIMGQPDFDSPVVIVVIIMGMLFLAGFPWEYFAVLVVTIASGIGLPTLTMPYCMACMAAFLNLWSDPLGKDYQLTHSPMAIARSSRFGEGLGASSEERLCLPEAHTDFIFTVVGEEFGFLGMLVLVSCYGWLVRRVFSIGKRARDSGLTFSAYVANGIGIWIGTQSFFNIGINIGIPPTKSLTLPSMSYGGPAVFIMLACVILLLRINYENHQKVCGYSVE